MVLDMTPKAARLQSQHDPYATAQFRTDIAELMAKKDLVEIGKRQLKDSAKSQNTGKVWEYANAWLAPDYSQKAEGLATDLNLQGREEYVRSHNSIVRRKFSNPDAKARLVVDGIKKVGEMTLEADFTVTTMNAKDASVKKLRVVCVFNSQYQASHATCSNLTPFVASPLLQVAQAPSYDRPCLHNLWDSVRTKKGVALLRCRTCVSQWKLSIFDVSKCKKFYSDEGCPKGDSCRHLHVHARKKCQAL
eukprot:TRINITY_DN10081_c0_g1_i1.p1 TRINITY_DN10081_c0_g1~~TRINITY_DN10081_c0_g1_i1.p1  ORF type:complete len:266 (+),score=61.71 TRINITY_DN10081_c0_g1_i1:57-800(+)